MFWLSVHQRMIISFYFESDVKKCLLCHEIQGQFLEYPTQVWQNLFFHLKKSWLCSCKQASNFLHERLYSTWTFGSYTHHFVKSSKVKKDQNPIGTTIIHSIEAPWNDNNVGYLVFFCSQLNCKNKGNVLKCCHY